jgi:hypothetical protein
MVHLPDEPKARAFRIVLDDARAVEEHSRAPDTLVSGPMWKTGMVRVTMPREVDPCPADLCRKVQSWLYTTSLADATIELSKTNAISQAWKVPGRPASAGVGQQNTYRNTGAKP